MENYIKELLENAGWYEGRRIATDDMIEEFVRAEMGIPDTIIIELLKEFWNLNIEFKTPDGRFSNIRLNTEAASGVDNAMLARISGLLNEKLIPVGLIHEDSALMLVSNTGKFYMAVNGQVYKIGDNFFEALNSIILQRNVIRVI